MLNTNSLKCIHCISESLSSPSNLYFKMSKCNNCTVLSAKGKLLCFSFYWLVHLCISLYKKGKVPQELIFKDVMHFFQKLKHIWAKWQMGLIIIFLRNSNISVCFGGWRIWSQGQKVIKVNIFYIFWSITQKSLDLLRFTCSFSVPWNVISEVHVLLSTQLFSFLRELV